MDHVMAFICYFYNTFTFTEQKVFEVHSTDSYGLRYMTKEYIIIGPMIPLEICSVIKSMLCGCDNKLALGDVRWVTCAEVGYTFP